MHAFAPHPNPLVTVAANARRVLTSAALSGIADYVCEARNPDGGFSGSIPPDGRGQGGASDAYYTLFALMTLAALGHDQKVLSRSRSFLQHQWRQLLDPVHRHACFLALALSGTPQQENRLLSISGKEQSTAYELFLHTLSAQVANTAVDERDSNACRDELDLLKTSRSGGYRNSPGTDTPNATATAAAMMVRRWTDLPSDADAEHWLLKECRTSCGFRNSPQARESDLLSTAVSVFALGSAGRLDANVALECLDFAEECRRSNGGFAAHPNGGQPDCEYTFYALLLAGCAGTLLGV